METSSCNYAQHLTYEVPDIRLGVARACVAGKVQNSRWVVLEGAQGASLSTKKNSKRLPRRWRPAWNASPIPTI